MVNYIFDPLLRGYPLLAKELRLDSFYRSTDRVLFHKFSESQASSLEEFLTYVNLTLLHRKVITYWEIYPRVHIIRFIISKIVKKFYMSVMKDTINTILNSGNFIRYIINTPKHCDRCINLNISVEVE